VQRMIVQRKEARTFVQRMIVQRKEARTFVQGMIVQRKEARTNDGVFRLRVFILGWSSRHLL